jgi:hypothetical protein
LHRNLNRPEKLGPSIVLERSPECGIQHVSIEPLVKFNRTLQTDIPVGSLYAAQCMAYAHLGGPDGVRLNPQLGGYGVPGHSFGARRSEN